MSQRPIHLDGTTLEGGGQLLRLSLSLASLVRVPFFITDIRGKRGPVSKPGKDGGIKSAHFAGAEWLARATNAETEGLEVKSRELLFKPIAGDATNLEDGQRAAVKKLSGGFGPEGKPDAVWHDIYEHETITRRESNIIMKSPGSVFLILQAILPYILFSSQPDPKAAASKATPVPIRITIEGGTNVWHSPSYEYAYQVLFPMLHTKLGIGPIDMNLGYRGWSTGRATVGKVTFDITPMAQGCALPGFSCQERGHLVKIHVSTFAPNTQFRASIRERVTKALYRLDNKAKIEFAVDEDSGHNKRLYLLLVAETSGGHRLGRDWLFDEKINEEKPHRTVDRLVSKVVQDLNAELAHGGCVDEYLQDQLVIFQALAKGKSKIDGGSPSLHTLTARWVCEKMLGIDFVDGHCEGIGFAAGQTKWDRESKGTAEIEEKFEAPNVSKP